MNKFKAQRGLFLIISILLTSILTATGMVLIKVTTSGQQASNNYIQTTKLLNSATTSIEIIEQAIDTVITSLNDAKANIYFVDNTVVPTIIVRDASTNTATITDNNLQQQLFANSATGSSNPMLLKVIPGIEGDFQISYNNLSVNPLNPAEALFNLKISAAICNQTDDCQKADKQTIKKRICPSGILTNKPMRPLLDNELPSGYVNAFPNLYCTCSESGFSKTTAAGDCETAPCQNGYYNSPPPNGSTCAVCSPGFYCTGGMQYPCTINNCTICTATSCTVCDPNHYLFNSTTCNVCPTTHVASCSPSGSFICAPGYYKNNPNATSCSACNSVVGVINCDNVTGNATQCNEGYGLVSGSCNPCVPGSYAPGGVGGCVSCSPGYYTSTFASGSCNTPCTSIPGVATCTASGTITGCISGYTLSAGTCVSACVLGASVNGTGEDAGSGCKCLNSGLAFWNGECRISCSSYLPVYINSPIFQNRVDQVPSLNNSKYCTEKTCASECASWSWSYTKGSVYSDGKSCICSQ